MNNKECEAIRELFEEKFNNLEKRIEEKFNAFNRRSDRLIESFNGKFEMTDTRITKNEEDMQKQLDNHCPRIRELEGKIIELQPSRNFYNKIRDFAVGSIIVLGGAVIAMASYIYDKLN